MNRYLLLNVAAYASGQYFWRIKADYKSQLSYASVLIGNFDVGARFTVDNKNSAEIIDRQIGDYVKSESQISEATILEIETKHESKSTSMGTPSILVLVEMAQSLEDHGNWNAFRVFLSEKGYLKKICFLATVRENHKIQGKPSQAIFSKYGDALSEGRVVIMEIPITKISEINDIVINGLQSSPMVLDTITNIGISVTDIEKTPKSWTDLKTVNTLAGLILKTRKLFGFPRTEIKII